MIDSAQRRARLATRHLLAAGAGTAEEVTAALVALHGTDPATVHVSAAVRLAAPGIGDVERALYEDGTLVRMTGMRRTMFVVETALAPVVHSSSTAAIAVRDRAHQLKVFEPYGWDDAWLTALEDEVVATLDRLGQATAAELAAEVPRLREKIVVSPGKPYEAKVSVSSRVLYGLSMQGRIVRGRPIGSWISSQYKWAPAPAMPDIPVAEAQRELAGRWLAAFGPGTETDLKWWTGWPLRDVRKALAALGAEQVELAEGTGYVLPGDAEPVPEPEPWAALLPALDPTPMGWKERGFYLPDDHREALFDYSGNIGPTVWWNGRIVGAWALTPAADIAWRLLTDVGAEATAAIEAQAARLTTSLAGTRFTPSMRTPLERELST